MWVNSLRSCTHIHFITISSVCGGSDVNFDLHYSKNVYISLLLHERMLYRLMCTSFCLSCTFQEQKINEHLFYRK